MTTAAGGADAPKLTLLQAVKDLGWFSSLFATAAGAPSILSILQKVFIDHRLVDALQWIVDGYNTLVGLAAHVVEPALDPIVSWLSSITGWNLQLHPHWRPILVLNLIFYVSMVRTIAPKSLLFFSGIVAAIFTSLAIGLMPIDGGWGVQAAIAALPVAVFMLFSMIDSFEISVVSVGIIMTALVAGIASALTFAPGLQQGAGIVTLGSVVIAMGIFALTLGDRAGMRLGLLVLGGFLAAGLIFAASMTVGALGGSTVAASAQVG